MNQTDLYLYLTKFRGSGLDVELCMSARVEAWPGFVPRYCSPSQGMGSCRVPLTTGLPQETQQVKSRLSLCVGGHIAACYPARLDSPVSTGNVRWLLEGPREELRNKEACTGACDRVQVGRWWAHAIHVSRGWPPHSPALENNSSQGQVE